MVVGEDKPGAVAEQAFVPDLFCLNWLVKDIKGVFVGSYLPPEPLLGY